MLRETHLPRRARRPASDSPAHSSGQEGRVGSCPGSGSVGLGYSSPEGRGTGWHTWCLKSKVQKVGSSLGVQPCPGLGQEAVPPSCRARPHRAPASATGAPPHPPLPPDPLAVWPWPWGPQATEYAGLLLQVVSCAEGHGPPKFVTHCYLISLFFSLHGYIMDIED